MARQALTGKSGESTGAWFDPDKAACIDEDTWWNGSNQISCATGSQWEHEALYRTAGGKWILNHWSQWQGSGESWSLVTDHDAAAWLVRNHADHPDAMAAIAANEVA